jgi:hypothetical protein
MTYLTDADPAEEVAPLGFTVSAARWRLSRTGERWLIVNEVSGS